MTEWDDAKGRRLCGPYALVSACMVRMRRALAFLLILLCTGTVGATSPPERRITSDQASALVMASLTRQQRRLPNVQTEQDDAPGPSKFMFFTVIWEGTPNGSVVVGNYAVDAFTGDVFSATMSCDEEKNKRLEVLQKQVRVKLGLSLSAYHRLKTTGPLCEK
jgi:hypothetical protein